MILNTYTFDDLELQKELNDVKTQLIQKINKDYKLNINPAEYIFVIQTRSCLGRFIDKLFGADPTKAHRILLRIDQDTIIENISTSESKSA
jgi:hypothetical protein